jgi:hypothetical protein
MILVTVGSQKYIHARFARIERRRDIARQLVLPQDRIREIKDRPP